jgi:hypothetical protein
MMRNQVSSRNFVSKNTSYFMIVPKEAPKIPTYNFGKITIRCEPGRADRRGRVVSGSQGTFFEKCQTA